MFEDAWDAYADAVERWERVTGVDAGDRRAPIPDYPWCWADS